MPGRWDLGFPGAVAVALLVFVHVISAAICRRWKLAQAMREEVEYLARLAAEEAAKAEMEAALSHVPASFESSGGEHNGGTLHFGCAVCHLPTTTRCSRCKIVRYCSGTCQIIDWRRGHKEECYHPQVDDHHQENNSHLRDLQAEKSELLDNTIGNKQKSHANPVATCFEGSSVNPSLSTYVGNNDIKKIRSFLDPSKLDSSFGISVDSSSSCSVYPVYLENSEDASATEGMHTHPQYHAKASEATFRDFTSYESKKAALTNSIEVTPVGIGKASCSVNNLSRKKVPSTCCTDDSKNRLNNSLASSFISSNHDPSTKFSRCTSNTKNTGFESGVFCPDIPSKHSDRNRTLRTSSTQENSFSESLDGTMESYLRDCRIVDPEKSERMSNRNSAGEWLLKAKRLWFRSISPADPAFVGGGKHFFSRDLSSNANDTSSLTSKFSKNTSPVLNTAHHLRTSAKSSVHQLKPSLTSGGHASIPVSDVCQKFKMNFSYELFAKLYNSDKADLKPFGLSNCGNSCFANAVLQCLVFTRPLAAYLLQGFHTAKCSRRGWCFTCEFENLILTGKQGQSPLSPVGILTHLDRIGSHLMHGREEDAHEFLRHAIDSMQYTCFEDAGNARVNFPKDTGLIQLTFGGYLLSEINCMKCKLKSEKLERMMDLTVEIQGDIGTLEQALKQFTSSEVLDGENRYHCNRCKSFERAKKKLSVFEAPNILTIALKRFQLGKFGKLNKSVRFPVNLNLSPYMSTADPCALYSLYAIVVHMDVMNAAFSGHYICFVESLKGKWYMINDSEVKPVELERVLKENAYMLFYARKTPHASKLIAKSERLQVSSKSPSWLKRGTTKHPSSHKPSDERLFFPRADSSSDSISLSCSEEGSSSTDSTMNSAGTEDLSTLDYLFGGSQESSAWSRPPHLSDDSDYGGDSEGMREQHSFSPFLCPDRTANRSGIMLTECNRGRETFWDSPYDGERSSSLLIQSSSAAAKERRQETLY